MPRRPDKWRIRSACLKLHQRRITAVDFPPASLNLACSACKKGLISVWDFDEVRSPAPPTRALHSSQPHTHRLHACMLTVAPVQVSERLSFEGIHGYQINSLRFVPGRASMGLVSASCDGHVCLSDIETGMHHSLVNLNPHGWVDGVTTERNWLMMQAVGVQHDAPDVAWAGDNRGNVPPPPASGRRATVDTPPALVLESLCNQAMVRTGVVPSSVQCPPHPHA